MCVDNAHLLPGLDLSISVNVRSVGKYPDHQMGGGGLSYRK